jgi:hypothetical protein
MTRERAIDSDMKRARSIEVLLQRQCLLPTTEETSREVRI